MSLYLTAFCPVLSECGEQLISVLLLTNLHLFKAICGVFFNPPLHYNKQFFQKLLTGVILWAGVYLCSVKLWLWLSL